MNKYTRQIMLYQLGYYHKKIDGIWGSGSIEATKEFQEKNGLTVDSIFGPLTEAKLNSVYDEFINGEILDADLSNIKYFKRSEFACKSLCGYDKISKQLIYNLDTLRYYIDEPIYITSGCRCKAHNKKVGGSTNSRHYNKETFTKAVDFYTKSTKKLSYRKKIIDFWIKYMPNTRYGYCKQYYNLLGKKGSISASSMGSSIHLDVV